jgi:anti-anti-sigma regulatory factor
MDKQLPIAGDYIIKIIPDNVLFITEQENPTTESSAQMTIDVLKAIKEHGITKALIDLSKTSTPSSGARKNIVNMFKKSRLDKISLFGTSTPIRVVAGFIMRAAGMENVQFFKTEEEAVAWLEEG